MASGETSTEKTWGWRKAVAIGLAALGLIATIGSSASKLAAANGWAQDRLGRLLPNRILAVLVQDEARCRFVLDWKQAFADCSPPKPAPLLARPYFSQREPQAPSEGLVATILKQPGVLVEVVSNTLGWLAAPLFIIAFILAAATGPAGPVMMYVAILYLAPLYVAVVCVTLLLYGLSALIGGVLGIVVWFWGVFGTVVVVILFFQKVHEKYRRLSRAIRGGPADPP